MSLESSAAFENEEVDLARITRTANVLKSLKPKKILVPDLVEVSHYLFRYPDLAELLPCVCALARKLFGPNAQLSLEMYHDPEIRDEYLTLYVRKDHYDEDMLKLIDKVYAGCSAEFERVSGGFLVTTDFQPPRRYPWLSNGGSSCKSPSFFPTIAGSYLKKLPVEVL